MNPRELPDVPTFNTLKLIEAATTLKANNPEAKILFGKIAGDQIVAFVMDRNVAAQIISADRVRKEEVTREAGRIVIEDTGVSIGALTAMEGNTHLAARRPVLREYFGPEHAEKLFQRYQDIIQDELLRDPQGYLDLQTFKRITLRIMLVSMGQFTLNEVALGALEKIFDIAKRRLTFEVKAYIPRLIQKALRKAINRNESDWQPDLSEDMYATVEEFFDAITPDINNHGTTPNSFFSRDVFAALYPDCQDVDRAMRDWLISLVLGTNAMDQVIAQVLFQSFKQTSDFELDQKKPGESLLNLAFKSNGKLPTGFISRMANKDITIISDGQEVLIPKGTRINIMLENIYYEIMNNPDLGLYAVASATPFGFGAQGCPAYNIVKYAAHATWLVSKSLQDQGIATFVSGGVGVKSEGTHAPLYELDSKSHIQLALAKLEG